MGQVLQQEQALPVFTLPRLRLRHTERRLLLFLGDVISLSGVAVTALLLRRALGSRVGWGQSVPVQAAWLVGLGLAWLMLWAANGGYDLRCAARVRFCGRRLLGVAALLGVLYLGAFFLLSLPLYAFQLDLAIHPPRLLPTLFLAGAFLTELAWRSLYASVLTGARFRRRLLIVGAGHCGQTMLDVLYERGDGSYDVVGFVDDDPYKTGRQLLPAAARGQAGAARRVLGDRHALKELIASHDVSTLVLAIRQEVNGELLPILLDCLELGVEIVPMPVLYEELTGRVPVEHVGGNWYVAMPLQHPGTGTLYSLSKRLMDIVLSSLGLLFLGLALPFIALAIKLDSPGPVFYTQERVGKGGRTFRAYKFRSMVQDAERGQARWAARNDSRVTRVGRLLRKAHIDEFPQFLNILKGEMSAVGPRPERPEFATQLAEAIPFYRVRHAVRPGMAGWALVQQGYAASVEDALLRLQYDLYYIKHQSLWLDVLILGRTVLDTLQLRGR